MVRSFFLGVIFSSLFLIFFHFVFAQTNKAFPSADIYLAIPGAWEDPTDPQTIQEFIQMYGTSSTKMVARWELEHSDLFHLNPERTSSLPFFEEFKWKKKFFTYCYFHYFSNTSPPDGLKKTAYKQNLNFEDFALHYKEDTIINSTYITSYNTPWAGIIGRGSTDRINGYGDQGNPDIFRGVDNGGAFFVWMVEPFADIYIELLRNGVGGRDMLIEYPSKIDENFKIIEWKKAEIIFDGTNNFSQSGLIKIKYSPDWKYADIYPPHHFNDGHFRQNKGAYFLRIKVFGFSVRPLLKKVTTEPAIQLIDGEPYLGQVISGKIERADSLSVELDDQATTTKDFYKYHLIKIIKGKGQGQTRLITSYATSRLATIDTPWDIIPDSSSEYKIVRRVILIRGWDSRNDRNNDGWIDDNEFKNLVNPQATARFRWQSRVFYGQGWTEVSGYYGVNFWNSDYVRFVGQSLKEAWQANNILGCYIDDFARNNLGNGWIGLYQSIPPHILKGGYLAEYNGRADEETAAEAWLKAYKLAIIKIKEITGSNLIGGNIGPYNPFTRPDLKNFIDVLDFFVAEDALKNGWAIDGWGGLAVRPGFQYPALAAHNKIIGISAHVRNISSDKNTQEMWERRITELLAIYYLINIPGKTYFRVWNSSYWYGSGNTIINNSYPAGYHGFWKAGVPQNYAYLPHKMLRVDIGVPENKIPPGKKPLDLTVEYDKVSGCYEWPKAGDSTSQFITLPTTGERITTTPTYIYILHQIDPRVTQSKKDHCAHLPFDAVYARNYTKGLVLYRTLHQYSGLWKGYEDNIATVPLPGLYRKVNYDGTLGPVINQISLRGFEGAILVKAEDYPSEQQIITDLKKYFKISLFADNYNPSSGDIVTYRAVLKNISTTTLIRTKFSLSLDPNLTYEPNSAYLRIFTTKYYSISYRPHQLIITLPYLQPKQEATLIWKMRKK